MNITQENHNVEIRENGEAQSKMVRLKFKKVSGHYQYIWDKLISTKISAWKILLALTMLM